MNTAFLLLGSNLGDSKEKLLLAVKKIEHYIGPVTTSSGFYRTAAWGNTAQPDFINQVIVINTHLGPQELIKTILDIEEQMGRKRTIKNAARIIDIDILFFNKEIINDYNLVVPHKEIQNRRFVLVPLAEIAGSFLHPTLHKTVTQLLNECTDMLNVQNI